MTKSQFPSSNSQSESLGVQEDRFDINARASGDAPSSELVHMVRSLLKDRFKLVLHTETREMPIYALTTFPSFNLVHPRAGTFASGRER